MSVNLKILSMWSDDIDDVNQFIPDDKRHVYFQVYLSIGDDLGNEYEFQVEVGTPQGASELASEHNLTLISNRNLILLNEYSRKTLDEVLNEILSNCEADDWDKSILKLQRYFLWEYEDFSR